MKMMKSFGLALSIALCVNCGKCAERFHTDINPALLYYQAFLVAPDFEPAEFDFLFHHQWHWGDMTGGCARFGHSRSSIQATMTR